MEMPALFFLFLLALCSFSNRAYGGPDGFISIDCGASQAYRDERDVDYEPDETFLEQKFSGKPANTSSDFSSLNLPRQLTALRAFPDGERNCYLISLKESINKTYLTRAYFRYGNYDGQNGTPQFDLYLGVYKWETIRFNASNGNETVIKEIVHFPSSEEINLCLVNTGNGTPFISALEVRRLGDNTYRTNYTYLKLFRRTDFGSIDNSTIQYPDDTYDRIWRPPDSPPGSTLGGLETDILSSSDYRLPPKVMKTAVEPATSGQTFMTFKWSPEIKDCQFFIHVAELVDSRNGTREFNITREGKYIATIITPGPNEAPLTRPSFIRFSEASLNLILNQTENSVNPPILNAIEIFMVENVTAQPTNQTEVDAMRYIRGIYQLNRRSWQGDPCAFQNRIPWEGVSCSLVSTPPNIISLNLSSSNLRGPIDSSFENLGNIEVLDLSNNLLDGRIPDFLSQLPSLKVLNLSRNKLTGEIPKGLIEKSNNRLLNFSYDPNLCLPGACKKKSHTAAIVAPIVSVFVLVVLVYITIRKLKKKRRELPPPEDPVSSEEDGPFRSNSRRFRFSEIISITNNFERTIGKGGFGTVSYGRLEDNTEVAVKMLSPSSIQGSKEFQAEAKLLMTVHHKNLTSLIGYCDEGTNMGLIYEYMPNGDLKDHLAAATSQDALSWRARLRMAIDAAHGLEYLHEGIKPPVIHRDVKTSNILLDENFSAKLADFGLSKAFSVESDIGITTQICGTPGYLDPEYYISKRLTKKNDIYSFGVVLLEIITGKLAIIREDGENFHISEWVTTMLTRGDGISSIMDPKLNSNSYDDKSARRVIDTALACVSMKVTDRPSMSSIVAELSECLKMEVARFQEKDVAEASQDSDAVSSFNTETESTLQGR